MAKNIRRIAELLGADVVTEVPDVGAGAWGAAHLLVGSAAAGKARDRISARSRVPSRASEGGVPAAGDVARATR